MINWRGTLIDFLSKFRLKLQYLMFVVSNDLFNNLTPPYGGWQMRGPWIARLYQPVFIVFLHFLARQASTLGTWRSIKNASIYSLFILTITLNAYICVGPALGSDYPGYVYEGFYRHGPKGMMAKNLQIYGRRPLGFCR